MTAFTLTARATGEIARAVRRAPETHFSVAAGSVASLINPPSPQPFQLLPWKVCIVTARMQAASSSVAGCIGLPSPQPLQLLPSKVCIVTARMQAASSSVASLINPPAPQPLQLLPSKVCIVTARMQAASSFVASCIGLPSTQPLQLLPSKVCIMTARMQAASSFVASCIGLPSPQPLQLLPSKVFYRSFSSGNAEYATKAEVSGNAEYATKAEVVKLEHKLDLVKRELESMVELVKQENKQIETLFDAHKEKTKADVMAGQNSVLKTYATVLSTVVTIVLGGIAIHEFMDQFGSTKNNTMTTEEQK